MTNDKGTNDQGMSGKETLEELAFKFAALHHGSEGFTHEIRFIKKTLKWKIRFNQRFAGRRYSPHPCGGFVPVVVTGDTLAEAFAAAIRIIKDTSTPVVVNKPNN
jgi:hypothetical protein